METKPEITYRKLDSLIPYARNARTHDDAQIAQIAASIREFGWTNPILIDGENGIIAGHGRILAARKLQMGEVPCIELDGMDDIQKQAYILADNKISLNAGWDDELLALELEELDGQEFDLSLIGPDAKEIDSITKVREYGENDPNEEWKGMPEFDQQDKTAFRSIVVHFKNENDVEEFARLNQQNITDKTRFIWFPFNENEQLASKVYV